MKRHAPWLAVLLLVSGHVASAQWRENGEAVPNKPWSKSDGDFGATFVFTDKPDELFAAWEKPSPGVHISETSKAIRGTPIIGIIYFTGCAVNAEANCELVARFTITTPEGKPWGDPIEADLWVDLPPPGKGELQLAVGNLGVIVEPGDSLGEYTAKAEILDRVSKKTMVLEQRFTAVEAPVK